MFQALSNRLCSLHRMRTLGLICLVVGVSLSLLSTLSAWLPQNPKNLLHFVGGMALGMALPLLIASLVLQRRNR